MFPFSNFIQYTYYLQKQIIGELITVILSHQLQNTIINMNALIDLEF